MKSVLVVFVWQRPTKPAHLCLRPRSSRKARTQGSNCCCRRDHGWKRKGRWQDREVVQAVLRRLVRQTRPHGALPAPLPLPAHVCLSWQELSMMSSWPLPRLDSAQKEFHDVDETREAIQIVLYHIGREDLVPHLQRTAIYSASLYVYAMQSLEARRVTWHLDYIIVAVSQVSSIEECCLVVNKEQQHSPAMPGHFSVLTALSNCLPLFQFWHLDEKRTLEICSCNLARAFLFGQAAALLHNREKWSTELGKGLERWPTRATTRP